MRRFVFFSARGHVSPETMASPIAPASSRIPAARMNLFYRTSKAAKGASG